MDKGVRLVVTGKKAVRWKGPDSSEKNPYPESLRVRERDLVWRQTALYRASRKCAVLPAASGLPAMSWKEEKTPAIGKGLLEWRGGVQLIGKGGWYDICITGKDGNR
jgi:hypothetical protein